MENLFLPDNYVSPTQGNYMKLRQGENTFRVLSSAIIGWEYWTQDNKPVRSKTLFKSTPVDIRRDNNGNPQKIKHFWAFIVWNYALNSIQIMEITQSTIQSNIKTLIDNKKWGFPQGYDITIVRDGEGLDTSYSVVPSPHSEVEQSILDEYNSGKNINLEALYDGNSPFEETKVKQIEDADQVVDVRGISFT